MLWIFRAVAISALPPSISTRRNLACPRLVEIGDGEVEVVATVIRKAAVLAREQIVRIEPDRGAVVVNRAIEILLAIMRDAAAENYKFSAIARGIGIGCLW